MIDCHCHVLGGTTADVHELHEWEKRTFGYAAANFLSIEGMGDASQNALAICWKLTDPSNYAFGGLHYRFSYDFGQEVQQLWELGLDGIKMIENKPTERKKLGYAQDDPRYDSLYRTASSLKIPFLIHVGDPREFWDKDRCPQWAKEAGYTYWDGPYPTPDQLYQETEHVLQSYPDIQICLAHLFFMSDDGERLCSLMDAYPSLYLDITSGTEMYYAFDKDPVFWRNFFLRYQDRILFGTDNCLPADENDRKIAREINEMELRFLTRSDRFSFWDKHIQGAGLPSGAVQKITEDNFRRFAGTEPRPLHHEKARAYLQARLNDPAYHLTEQETKTIKTVIEML